jgi:hypothetical protein
MRVKAVLVCKHPRHIADMQTTEDMSGFQLPAASMHSAEHSPTCFVRTGALATCSAAHCRCSGPLEPLNRTLAERKKGPESGKAARLHNCWVRCTAPVAGQQHEPAWSGVYDNVQADLTVRLRQFSCLAWGPLAQQMLQSALARSLSQQREATASAL